MMYFEDNCDRCGLRMRSDRKQRKEGARLLCVSCTHDTAVSELAPNVRKLLVTDIRCGGCDAPPGFGCAQRGDLHRVQGFLVHWFRKSEYEALRDAGWQWQEVDPTDRGARKE